MFRRQNVADFLQGLFVLPLCALFGLMVGLLFHWHGLPLYTSVAFCALFPMGGALRTRQRALLAGLAVGLIFSVFFYLILRPHA